MVPRRSAARPFWSRRPGREGIHRRLGRLRALPTFPKIAVIVASCTHCGHSQGRSEVETTSCAPIRELRLVAPHRMLPLSPARSTVVVSSPHLLLPGTVFHDRYEVVRCIKAGGMGAIYEAVHRATGRRLALKTMLASIADDADLRARFDLEARVAACIESEHMVEVVDAGVDPETGIPFLVMELLLGEDLDSILTARGPLCFEDVVLILHQVALVLDRTHRAKVLHRDLKPENLFVTQRDDGSLRIKLLDFGIAKVMSSTTRAKTTRNIGTPLYMSPEQMRGDGDIGHRSDLYSLGHVAFTLLTGESYWKPEAESSSNYPALLLRILEGPSERARKRSETNGVALPEGFDRWFEQATAPDPDSRFPSASDQIRALAEALGVSLPRPHVASFWIPEAPAETTDLRAAPPIESVRRVVTDEPSLEPVPEAESPRHSRRPTRWRSAARGLVPLGVAAAGTIFWWAFRSDVTRSAPDAFSVDKSAPGRAQSARALSIGDPGRLATGKRPAADGYSSVSGSGTLPGSVALVNQDAVAQSVAQAAPTGEAGPSPSEAAPPPRLERPRGGSPSWSPPKARAIAERKTTSRDPTDIR